MVSNASDDLPDPDTPVITVNFSWGRESEMFLRLWTRAPWILINSSTGISIIRLRSSGDVAVAAVARRLFKISANHAISARGRNGSQRRRDLTCRGVAGPPLGIPPLPKPHKILLEKRIEPAAGPHP